MYRKNDDVLQELGGEAHKSTEYEPTFFHNYTVVHGI